MDQTTNIVKITGILVKTDLEVKNLGQPDESLGGHIVLRTADGSEHEVNYFANKYKKDAVDKKKFSNDLNGLHKGYETIVNEFKSLETNPDDADVVTIGSGEFGTQDYVDKKDTEKMIHYNDIKAKFANRVEVKDLETTPQVATFEVSGIVTKLTGEMKKGEATGNGEVHVDIIGYQANLVPVTLIVPATIVEGFSTAGFYETGLAKFSGTLINTKVTETVVEKQTFGADIVKELTLTVRRSEIAGGSPLGTIFDIKDGSEEAYEAAKSKRRLKLQEVKTKFMNKGQAATEQTGFTAPPAIQQTPPPANANPFGKNPFAK